MSVAIKVTDTGFDEILSKTDGIEKLDQNDLLQGIGRFLQESTRERIEVTKKSPDGASWQANRAGTSTLYDTGNLSASIDYQVSGSSVSIGSALVYSAIHQFGGTIKPKRAKKLTFTIGNKLIFATKVEMPARPYLGLSQDDKTGILEAAEDMLKEVLQ